MRNSIVTWALIIVGHWVAVLWTAPADAQVFENLDRIDTLVSSTVGANIGEPGGAVAPVDRRLRLAACPQIPAIEGPVFGAAIVRCDRIGWRIRVPLKLEKPQVSAAVQPYGRAPQPVQHSIMIKKGDPVQLVAGDAMFSVSRAMVADEDGAVGEMISVRADRNSPPVTGRVEPDGIIRVPGI